ncbi:MAG: hypothetical protein IJ872_05290 [Eubacterium sp.]|nr:hypothetical protein [Eubacterium sp.]
MKKVLSLTLALVMLLSCFGAFTAQAETSGVSQLSNQISNAAKYIANNSDMSSLSYGDYWLLTDAGYDMSAYKATYLENLKANLTKNDGKIIIEGTEWYQDQNGDWKSYSYSYEDIGVYGAVILTLRSMKLDPTAFESYDITAAFKNFDLSTISNPYSYRLAILAAGEDAFAKTLADDMIARFYTKGSGMNYYGYSCDNTGHFLAALYPSVITGLYDEYIDDACGVLKSYTKEDGAYADNNYVTTVNADSTALAMLGFSSALDANSAYWYYQKLIDNFYNPETGAFTVNGNDDTYATKDALLSLIQFSRIANKVHVTTDIWQVTKAAGFNHNGVYLSKCPICGNISAEYIPALKSVTLSATSYTYSGSAKTPAVTVRDVEGNVVNSKYYTVKYTNNIKVGTATATVTFSGLYTGTVSKNFTIKKAPKKANTLVAKGKTATVKFASLKKKNMTVAQKKAFAISKAQGKVTYKKASGNKKITVAKNGKITVKKGLKKGAYKVKVKVTAAGNTNYKAATKTATVTIIVK